MSSPVAPGDGTGSALPGRPLDPRLANVIVFPDALAEGARHPVTPVSLNGDDLLFLQYTGGTTGVSKGAALTHRNLVANTLQFRAFLADVLRPGRGSRGDGTAALSHLRSDGELHRLLLDRRRELAGAQSRDMDGFVEILKQSRCTLITGVNTLFSGLTLHPRIRDVDFSSLRLAIGAEPPYCRQHPTDGRR